MARFVLIGGGKNGRNGEKYETEVIDREVVKITNKKRPKFLFLAHGNKYEDSYYEVMKNIYETRFNCISDILKYHEVYDEDISKRKLEWADIIYIGGGNTLKMINFWKKSKFDKILKEQIKEDKTFAGISAGAICWCKYGLSDSRKSSDTDPYIKVSGLNIFNMLYCPHYDESKEKQESLKRKMKRTYKIPAIASENGTAIIIEDEKYKIIRSLDGKNIYKCFYKNGKYYKEKMEFDNIFHEIEQLYEKNK